VVVKLITKISPITAQMMLDKENATHDIDAEINIKLIFQVKTLTHIRPICAE
jgi:hypothetical protein